MNNEVKDAETIALIDHYARQISTVCNMCGYPDRHDSIVYMADRLFELARSLPKAPVS